MKGRKQPEDDAFVSPLEDEDPLLETLYQVSGPAEEKRRRGPGRRRPLPEGRSYRLVTFSFYEEDVERLDALLSEARQQGKRKVSRSQIVRLALRQVDLDQLPDEI